MQTSGNKGLWTSLSNYYAQLAYGENVSGIFRRYVFIAHFTLIQGRRLWWNECYMSSTNSISTAKSAVLWMNGIFKTVKLLFLNLKHNIVEMIIKSPNESYKEKQAELEKYLDKHHNKHYAILKFLYSEPAIPLHWCLQQPTVHT